MFCYILFTREILDMNNDNDNDLGDDTGIDINVADKLIAAMSSCSSNSSC